jgi:hypothetical protein
MAVPVLLQEAGYTHDMVDAVEFTERSRNAIGFAAAQGLIPDARKYGGRWFFTETGLRQWVLCSAGISA